MLTTENRGLHFLFEEPPRQKKENFVVFCSECTCVLRVSRGHVETGDVIESLMNRCPGCGVRLERTIGERVMSVSEDWGEISLSAQRAEDPGRLLPQRQRAPRLQVGHR